MNLLQRVAQRLFRLFAPTPVAPITSSPTRPDAHDIAKAVASHCRVIGCDESNTIAAVAWAFKEPGDTLAAVRAGNKRADSLRRRQRVTHAPTAPTAA